MPQDTVARILDDAAVGALNEPPRDDIDEFIAATAAHAVGWADWQAINAVETALGEACDPARPRVKLTEWEALRAAAGGVGRR